MKDNYPKALHFVLLWEGGVSDVQGDDGGLTNRGITNAEFKLWRERRGEEAKSVVDMTDAEMQGIYSESYWHPVSGDSLPGPLDMIVFNAAVNMGVGAARTLLTQAMGRQVSSRPGPYTEAVKELMLKTPAEVKEIAEGFLDLQQARYDRIAEIPHDHRFLRGWIRRMDALRAAAGL